MKHNFLVTIVGVLTLFLSGCSDSDSPGRAEKIACIGTSITDGYVLPTAQTYPVQLQTLEGTTNKVLNYGVGGTTALKKGDSPYWSAQKYQYALDWKPSIVIIEFGTNDSKKQNWRYKSEFTSDYTSLIRSFQQLSSSPRIYMCVPPPAFNTNFDVDPTVLKNEIMPLVNAIAKENNIELIDLYTPLVGKDSLFVDGIHPNAKGAALIASEVYKVISPK